MSVAVTVLLALGSLAATIGAVGLVRLATPFERLHAGTFVTVTSGVALTVAAAITDGFTDRVLKLVAIVVVLLVTGALGNHVIARALHFRGGERR